MYTREGRKAQGRCCLRHGPCPRALEGGGEHSTLAFVILIFLRWMMTVSEDGFGWRMSSPRRRLTSREPARLTLHCSCLGGNMVTRKEDTFRGQEDLGLNSKSATDQLRDHVPSELYMGMAVSVSWKHCRH